MNWMAFARLSYLVLGPLVVWGVGCADPEPSGHADGSDGGSSSAPSSDTRGGNTSGADPSTGGDATGIDEADSGSTNAGSTSSAGDEEGSDDESTGADENPHRPLTKIYWNEELTVMRADLDGSNAEPVFDVPSDNIWVEAIAFDSVNEKIIVVEQYEFGMWRANLDGSNVEQIATVDNPFQGLAVSEDGFVYWSIGDLFGHQALWRAELDGSNPTKLRDDDDFAGLHLAGEPASFFVALQEPPRFARLGLDGSTISTYAWPGAAQESPMFVRADLHASRMYFQLNTFGGDFIQAADLELEPDLELSNIEVLVTEPRISAFDVDLAGEKIYWRVDLNTEGWKIKRANLDGTGAEIVHEWPDDSTIRGTMALLPL